MPWPPQRTPISSSWSVANRTAAATSSVPCAPHDVARPAVDHRVPHGSRLVVPGDRPAPGLPVDRRSAASLATSCTSVRLRPRLSTTMPARAAPATAEYATPPSRRQSPGRAARPTERPSADARARSRRPTASSGWPDASRFGRRRRAACGPTRRRRPRRAGSGPTQARCSASSPFRNRCARTPPVARPLAGNSAKSDSPSPLPGSVPSSVSLARRDRDDDRAVARVGGHAREVRSTCAPAAEVDARHAAGRAALRAHGGRREPQQLRIGCHEHELVGLVALHARRRPRRRPSAR